MARTGPGAAAKVRARPARRISRWATLLAAIAVFVQLAALPYHHMPSGRDLATVAADLKAAFGPTALLCAQVDDRSSPAPNRPQGGHDLGCPLCQFASHAVLLDAPPPALPMRLAIVDGAPPPQAEFTSPRAGAIRLAQPRAPPAFA